MEGLGVASVRDAIRQKEREVAQLKELEFRDIANQLAVRDAELAEANAATRELEAEIADVNRRSSDRATEQNQELANHNADFNKLRKKAQEAQVQLAGAYEALTELETKLDEEREARVADVQAFAAQNREEMKELELCSGEADPEGDVAVLTAELEVASARADRSCELLTESEQEGSQLEQMLVEADRALFECAAYERAACSGQEAEAAELAADFNRRSKIVKHRLCEEAEQLRRAEDEAVHWRTELGGATSSSSSPSAHGLGETQAKSTNRFAELSVPALQEKSSSRATECASLQLQLLEANRRLESVEQRGDLLKEEIRRAQGEIGYLLNDQKRLAAQTNGGKPGAEGDRTGGRFSTADLTIPPDTHVAEMSAFQEETRHLESELNQQGQALRSREQTVIEWQKSAASAQQDGEAALCELEESIRVLRTGNGRLEEEAQRLRQEYVAVDDRRSPMIAEQRPCPLTSDGAMTQVAQRNACVSSAVQEETDLVVRTAPRNVLTTPQAGVHSALQGAETAAIGMAACMASEVPKPDVASCSFDSSSKLIQEARHSSPVAQRLSFSPDDFGKSNASLDSATPTSKQKRAIVESLSQLKQHLNSNGESRVSGAQTPGAPQLPERANASPLASPIASSLASRSPDQTPVFPSRSIPKETDLQGRINAMENVVKASKDLVASPGVSASRLGVSAQPTKSMSQSQKQALRERIESAKKQHFSHLTK